MASHALVTYLGIQKRRNIYPSSRKSDDRLTEEEEADGEDATESQEEASIFEDEFHQKVIASPCFTPFKGRRKLRISLENTPDYHPGVVSSNLTPLTESHIQGSHSYSAPVRLTSILIFLYA